MTESALLADNKILCIFLNKALKALSVFQFNLKLNNSHTSLNILSFPLKCRSQCFLLHCIQIFMNTWLWSHDALVINVLHRKEYMVESILYYRQTTVCVRSPYYLAWFVVCLSNVLKTLHVFDPYIMLHLHWECFLFLGTHEISCI